MTLLAIEKSSISMLTASIDVELSTIDICMIAMAIEYQKLLFLNSSLSASSFFVLL